LSRRSQEHYKTYKNHFNKEIELILFSIIDPQYTSQAEKSISHYFNGNKLNDYKINGKDQNELIIINKNNLSQIKEHYKLIQNSYIGHYKELHDKIISLEKDLLNEKNQHELTKKDHELTKKDHEFTKKDHELTKNELEHTKKEMEMALKIVNLEKQVLEMKLKEL